VGLDQVSQFHETCQRLEDVWRFLPETVGSRDGHVRYLVGVGRNVTRGLQLHHGLRMMQRMYLLVYLPPQLLVPRGGVRVVQMSQCLVDLLRSGDELRVGVAPDLPQPLITSALALLICLVPRAPESDQRSAPRSCGS